MAWRHNDNLQRICSYDTSTNGTRATGPSDCSGWITDYTCNMSLILWSHFLCPVTLLGSGGNLILIYESTFGWWPLTKKTCVWLGPLVMSQMSLSCNQFHQRDLAYGFISNIFFEAQTFHKKAKIAAELFYFFFLTSYLTTPQTGNHWTKPNHI